MTKVLTSQSRSIRIKGRSFLAVVLTPDLPLDDWLTRLDDLASRSAGFFLGRPVVLDVNDLPIDRATLKGLIADLAERRVSIMGLEGAKPSMVEQGMPPVLKGGRPVSDVEVEKVAPTFVGAQDAAAEKAAEAGEDGAPHAGENSNEEKSGQASLVMSQARGPVSSLIIREPVRSGQSVIFTEGDVTVIGSVASGAEIIAGGSIHIYGVLRGRAMAGSVGNASARIFCRKLEAELIAIDGIYKMADDFPDDVRGHPVQLWLEEDAIHTEKLL